MNKQFQAFGKAGRITKDTPKQAAEAYFAQFPASRKCNVIEGVTDGPFFTVMYGRKSDGEWPRSYHDVTKRTASELPDQ